jgi:hypothetical protein
MTSKELHKQKIIPLRMELNKLEEEYKTLYRKECAEKIGAERADCSNCAYSCVLEITDHNCCMGGSCTCCHNWCYKWMPENKISAYLREHHEYDSEIYYRLEDVFGDDFLKCDNVELVMEMLELIDKIDKYVKGDN